MSSKDQKNSLQHVHAKNNHAGITTSPTFKNLKSKPFLFLSGILLLTFICFSPSLKNNFTNWDDPTYLTENRMLTDISKNFKEICTSDVSCNYHPLTILSLAVDYHFSALKPFRYHLVNIVFHLLNTLLVFFFAYRHFFLFFFLFFFFV